MRVMVSMGGRSAESSEAGARKEVGTKQNDVGGAGNAPLQLTEEEKAVLMECRRNSAARGMASAAGSLILLRALVGSGRAPLHVQRWSSVYYTSVGAVTFLAGMRSYRQVCLDKILSLEHSALADQLRQHQRSQQGWSDEDPLPSLPVPSPPPPRTQPHTVTNNKPFSSTGPSDSVGEQPDAFASSSLPQPPLIGDYETTPSNIRGRTFDEIRDENRRRQHQKLYPQNRVGGVRGEDASRKPVNVRRNKYGDIISEE